MRLRAPLSLGGAVYLAAVSVGRDPDDESVHDCAGCDGYVYRDCWHLTGVVLNSKTDGGGDRTTGQRERYHYCSDDCLQDWLAVAAR